VASTASHPLSQPTSTILIWVVRVGTRELLAAPLAGATCSASPRVPESSGLAASAHRYLLVLLDWPHSDI